MGELEQHWPCQTPMDPQSRQWVYFQCILLEMIGEYDNEVMATEGMLVCECVRAHVRESCFTNWNTHTVRAMTI